MTQNFFKLNNGAQIPAIGLGTWQSTEEEVYNAVLTALNSGYRHIDTAFAYGNEASVGKAIKESGIPRSDIFVTTKLAPIDLLDVEKALNKSLNNLGLEYVDLYLMHWPVALNPENKSHPLVPVLPNGKRDIIFDRSFVSTYVDMQALIGTGKTKAIGVSNFSVKNLQKLLLLKDVNIKPAVNQVELHPYLPQHKLLQFCKDHEILLEAYSPLGSTDSPLLKDKKLGELAAKHNVSIANILISWAVWRGTVVLPKSVTAKRIVSNFKISELSDLDGNAIDNLSKTVGSKRLIIPDWDPVIVFNDEE